MRRFELRSRAALSGRGPSRRTALALSAAFFARPAAAALRPRYGGTLRVQVRSWATSIDPVAAGENSQAREWLSAALFERLISLDEQGRPQPQLAVSWQWDGRRWTFRLRPEVRFHDGSALTAADAAAALESLRAVAQGDSVAIAGARPLADFARTRHSVVKHLADSTPVGTGPFKLMNWQPERRAALQAHLAHWAGRPFLDEIRFEMGRGTRDAALEVEVGRADVAEIGLGDVRRSARVAQSMPAELVALEISASVPAEQREALALSIDRASIHQVLLQRQGAISGALLPQWLSGYAYLFSTARDLSRARQLARTAPLSAGYDASDPAAKAIVDRIAVNAREAGLNLRSGGENAPVRLTRVRVASPDPTQALAVMAHAFGLEFPTNAPASAAGLYAAEKALLDDFRVIPLVHLPDSFALGRQVRNWKVSAWGGWDPANVWLSPERKP